LTTPAIAVIAAVALVLVVAAAVVGLAWRSSGHAIHPGTATFAWGLKDYPELRAEEVEVKSSTGAALAGRFFPGKSRATVVLTHGYGGNQDELLPTADALHKGGFSVFTYDLRGCGRSSGEVTFGAKEQDDLRSVVDYLAGRDDVDDQRIGALGFSMGAATTLMEAAKDTRIKAVVDDSGWSDVYHWLRPSWSAVFIHPRDAFSALSLKFAEWRTGTDLDDLKPREDVPDLAGRPLLIIHGTADQNVPPGDSEENFAAAREPKELWMIDGAAHGATVEPGGAASSERVVAFFRDALLGNRDGSAG
jgi:alpha-beta hydrolase superfamily lysophospholipase